MTALVIPSWPVMIHTAIAAKSESIVRDLAA
jgi:hypothetical protein